MYSNVDMYVFAVAIVTGTADIFWEWNLFAYTKAVVFVHWV